MPLDKQGASFLAARLSNETSGRGRGKDPKEYFEGERPNLDRIQAVSPRFVAETNCSFFSGLVGFALPQAIIASVVLDEFVNAQRGKMAGTPEDHPEKSS